MVDVAKDFQSSTYRDSNFSPNFSINSHLTTSVIRYLASTDENLQLLGQIPTRQRAVDGDFHETSLERPERVVDAFIQYEVSVELDEFFARLQCHRYLVAIFFQVEVGDGLKSIRETDLKGEHERVLELLFSSLELEY